LVRDVTLRHFYTKHFLNSPIINSSLPLTSSLITTNPPFLAPQRVNTARTRSRGGHTAQFAASSSSSSSSPVAFGRFINPMETSTLAADATISLGVNGMTVSANGSPVHCVVRDGVMFSRIDHSNQYVGPGTYDPYAESSTPGGGWIKRSFNVRINANTHAKTNSSFCSNNSSFDEQQQQPQQQQSSRQRPVTAPGVNGSVGGASAASASAQHSSVNINVNGSVPISVGGLRPSAAASSADAVSPLKGVKTKGAVAAVFSSNASMASASGQGQGQGQAQQGQKQRKGLGWETDYAPASASAASVLDESVVSLLNVSAASAAATSVSAVSAVAVGLKVGLANEKRPWAKSTIAREQQVQAQQMLVHAQQLAEQQQRQELERQRAIERRQEAAEKAIRVARTRRKPAGTAGIGRFSP
jgi:hypothetical protein